MRPNQPASTYFTSSGDGRPFEQHAGDFQARVEPDKVGKRQRPHRVVEPELARQIDVADRRHALAQREAGFVEHRHQDAVYDEARRIIGVDDRLAELLPERLDRLHRRVRRGEAADQLDQAHHRHGVEEMHADETARIGGGLRQPRDRDRGGVGRENRGVGQHLADLREDRALDFLALGRRFDDEEGRAHLGDARHRLDQRECGVAGVSGDLFLGHQPVERLGDACLARCSAFQRHVAEQHMKPRLRRNLRDARAHLTRADYAYRLHIPSFAPVWGRFRGHAMRRQS